MRIGHQTAVFLLILSASLPVAADTCTAATCQPGQHVTIYTSSSEPAALCPTEALSAYANFVLGLGVIQSEMGHFLPKDPNDLEASQEGETAVMVKHLREQAGVGSAREAFAACRPGKSGIRGTVIQADASQEQLKVSPEKSGTPFWLPANFADKR